MQNAPIQIRQLSSGDADTYRALRLESFQESPLSFSESYEDECERPIDDYARELTVMGDPPEWFILGAFAGDTLVGFVKFRRDQRSKARHKSMIHAMYTTPERRGQGIGKQLVSALLNRVRSIAGLEQIHLWVLHADTSASEFYRKCGFESQGTRVKKDLKIGDVYVDAEYMVLVL